jgi:hypothetical protein
VPTLVVGMYALRADASCRHVCALWERRRRRAPQLALGSALIVALRPVADATKGAYIATQRVATYAPPAEDGLDYETGIESLSPSATSKR